MTPLTTEQQVRHAMMATILRAMIAGQIRGLRQSRGMSQAEMARGMKTSQAVVSHWEDPQGPWMSTRTLRDIASFFDVALMINFTGWRSFISEYCGKKTPVPPSFSQEAAT
jgi:transcriptional regulator with XRE-family HTH domain